MGVGVHMGVKRVPRVGARIHVGSIQQPWLGASIVIGNSSYVYKNVSRSLHESPESTWESQKWGDIKS